MTEQSSQWQELADRVEALALKLKLHAEQVSDDGEVRDAMGRLRADVDDAFKAAGNAVQDHAVREDVREVGRLLTDAPFRLGYRSSVSGGNWRIRRFTP